MNGNGASSDCNGKWRRALKGSFPCGRPSGSNTHFAVQNAHEHVFPALLLLGHGFVGLEALFQAQT
jgi:hypothetical protein